MAQFSSSETTGTMDTTYTAIPSIPHVPTEQRIYGRTEKILRLVRNKVKTTRIMITKSREGKLPPVDDFRIYYKSDVEREILLDVNSASLSGTVSGQQTDVLQIPNAQAAMIDGNPILIVQGVFFGNGYSGGSTGTWATSASLGRTQLEALRVVSKGVPGATYTPVTVIRAWLPADGSAPSSSTVVSLTGKKVLLQPKPQPLGSNEGNMYGDTPHEEYNFVEQTLEKWGVIKAAEKVRIYQDKSIAERNGERQLDNFWKKVDIQKKWGRRNYYIDAQEQPVYETGGLDEYIETPQSSFKYVPYDGDPTNANGNNHIIDFSAQFGNVTYTTLNSFGEGLFDYGSTEKFLCVNKSQYTKISNAFDNKMRIQAEKEMSIKYGFEVESLKISGGGKLYLIQDDLESQYNISNACYVLDFEYFKHIIFADYDFSIMMDAEKELNKFKTVNYLHMISGNKRTNPFSMYKVINFGS